MTAPLSAADANDPWMTHLPVGHWLCACRGHLDGLPGLKHGRGVCMAVPTDPGWVDAVRAEMAQRWPEIRAAASEEEQ